MLCRGLLDTAHECHAGINKMKSNLRAYAYWPGMNRMIEQYVSRCPACTVYQSRGDAAPLQPVASKEDIPWNTIAIYLTGPSDLLQSRVLLTIIDLHSRYPEVYVLKQANSREIMTALTETFARFGLPENLITENGSKLNSFY